MMCPGPSAAQELEPVDDKTQFSQQGQLLSGAMIVSACPWPVLNPPLGELVCTM
jgi:hypothetical protein